MADPITLSSSVLANFLAANAGTINAVTGAAATTAAGAGADALLNKAPKGPKAIATPEPDSKLARADKQRRLAAQYADQGRVGSVFGKDKLG